MNHESLVGRLVKDSDGDVTEVQFIDKSVGITLQTGNVKICINGPMSPNREDNNYDELFDFVVKGIDNWFIDMEEMARIYSNGTRIHAEAMAGIGRTYCAVGG